jgi:hypothetical protein
MPIYYNLGGGGKGESGYSGENPESDEIFPQNTFTPAHDKWSTDYDISFVGDIPTYNGSENDSADIYCVLEDLLQPLVVGATYRFEWTIQNTTGDVEDLQFELWATDFLGALEVRNGTTGVDFIWPEDQEWAPYPYLSGSAEGTFEIVSMSLKLITQGTSGYSGNNTPPIGVSVNNASDINTLVTQFNALLTSLKNAGIMEENPPS